MIGARYAAIGGVGPGGKALESFTTYGIMAPPPPSSRCARPSR